MHTHHVERFLSRGVASLRHDDPVLYDLLEREHARQARSLSLVASSGGTDPSVMASLGTSIVNVTAEGYPGKRYHAGCHYVDQVEQLAIDRAKKVFGATYVNVQPHCASFANHTVMHAVLRPGDTILGMALDQGGHLTHGAPVNISGRLFRVVSYGLSDDGLIDYGRMRELAQEHRPRMLVCGTTSYTRVVDFARIRRIADDVGAYVLADVTHIAGLVAAGLHPSPIPHAHFTTTCTFKQLFGPRGGLIMMGRDAQAKGAGGGRTLSQLIQSAVFPLMQGSPEVHAIAGKARAMGRLLEPSFRSLAQRIRDDADALAMSLAERGYEIVSGGTDNHIVLVRLPASLQGDVAAKALEACDILANKNKVPGDTLAAATTSGLRFGTNTVALRQMGPSEMATAATLIDQVLAHTRGSDGTFELPDAVRSQVRDGVHALCRKFPMPYDAAIHTERGGALDKRSLEEPSFA